MKDHIGAAFTCERLFHKATGFDEQMGNLRQVKEHFAAALSQGETRVNSTVAGSDKGICRKPIRNQISHKIDRSPNVRFETFSKQQNRRYFYCWGSLGGRRRGRGKSRFAREAFGHIGENSSHRPTFA